MKPIALPKPTRGRGKSVFAALQERRTSRTISDRHLTRLAAREGTTPAVLCDRLALATGDSRATVDIVLWRAANLGLTQV